MLYALLHLTGYDLSLDDIKSFRQWGEQDPRPPENGLVPGVELSNRPLGLGFANGVGMALAEKWLAARYNKPGPRVNRPTTPTLSSPRAISGKASPRKAASLAGTLKLGKLIYLYDDNDISIEGSTDITFTENVGTRFEAYGWQVVGPVDGMNVAEVEAAIKKAQAEKDKPSLIICRTTIGYGSPNKANKASAHGEPLGEDEVLLTKENLGWQWKEPFTVPEEAAAHCRKALDRGKANQQAWTAKMDAYRKAFPEEAKQLEQDLSGKLPAGWDEGIDALFASAEKPMATREASGKVMNLVAPRIPALLGGSADLGPSNKTVLAECGEYGFENYCGRNLHFGIREHAMGSARQRYGRTNGGNHSLHRHLLRFQRLYAPAHPHGGPDGYPLHLRLQP
jgi:transketolase